jgi:hypothetical protein
VVNKTYKREEDSLTSRGFDDCRFAYACSVEIDIGAFLCCFFLDVEVEELYHIADEVG